MSSAMVQLQLLLLLNIGWTVVAKLCEKHSLFVPEDFDFFDTDHNQSYAFLNQTSYYTCDSGYDCCYVGACCKTRSFSKWLIAVIIFKILLFIFVMLRYCNRSTDHVGHVTMPVTVSPRPLDVATAHEQVPPSQPVGFPGEQFYPGGKASSAPACESICVELPPPSYDAAILDSRPPGEKEASWK